MKEKSRNDIPKVFDTICNWAIVFVSVALLLSWTDTANEQMSFVDDDLVHS